MTFNNASVDVDYRFNSSAGGPFFIEGSTGNTAVGTATPGAKFHVAGDTGSLPSLSAVTFALFSNSSAAGDSCFISLVSGNTGSLAINMGDTDSETDGQISYNNNSRVMDFRTAEAGQVRIQSTGFVTVGDNLAVTDSLMHLHLATAGAASAVAGTVLTIENSADAFITILTPNADTGGLIVGRPSDNDAGQWMYDNNIDEWQMGFASQVFRRWKKGVQDEKIEGFSVSRGTTGVSTLIPAADIGLSGLIFVTHHVDDGAGGQDVNFVLLSYNISIDGTNAFDVIQQTGDVLGGVTTNFQFTGAVFEVNVTALSPSHVLKVKAHLMRVNWSRN